MDEERMGGCYDLKTAVIILLIISIISFVLIFTSIYQEEKQTESVTSEIYFNNSSFFSVKKSNISNTFKYNYTSNFWVYKKEPDYLIFKILSLNGSDYSNSTLTINMSYIAEMKESNGSLIIEIRK